MAELQNPDPLVEAVARARAESSRRPDLKQPTGRLNQIGNHVYAYSGQVQVNTSLYPILTFQTNSKHVVADVNLSGGTREADVTGGNTTLFKLSFNDIVVDVVKVESAQEDAPSSHTFKILIPPYTNVTIEGLTNSSTAGWFTCASIVGEAFNE